MTQHEHTPGPWSIGEGGLHVYYVNPEIEAGNDDIDDPRHDSIVAKCSGMGAFSGIPDEEREANARLIAAAPNLLAACKQIRADMGIAEWGSPEHAQEILSELIDSACGQLDAAIAKAEEQDNERGETMSEKHTPGPWEWAYSPADDKNALASPQWLECNDDDRYPVVLRPVTSMGPDNQPVLRLAADNEQDYRLIQAAPELLAACKAASQLEQFALRSSDDLNGTIAVCETIDAAIAKAEGTEVQNSPTATIALELDAIAEDMLRQPHYDENTDT